MATTTTAPATVPTYSDLLPLVPSRLSQWENGQPIVSEVMVGTTPDGAFLLAEYDDGLSATSGGAMTYELAPFALTLDYGHVSFTRFASGSFAVDIPRGGSWLIVGGRPVR